MIESTEHKHFPWFTTLFSLLLVIVYTTLSVLSKSLNINPNLLENYGVPYATNIFLGKIYGVVSNNIIHINLFHLIVNLLGLWLLGAFIERRIGWFKMATFGLTASIFGSIVQLLCSDDAGLGIAAALFGFYTLILMMSFKNEEFKMKFIYQYGILMFIFLFAMMINNQIFGEEIAIESKFAGIFWGFCVGVCQRNKVIKWNYILLLFLPFAFVSFMILYAPWSSQWNCAKAISFHRKHELKQAEKYYKTALTINPNNQLARENLILLKIDRLAALAYNAHKSGEYTAARRYYFRILNLDKNHHWAKENLKELP